MRSKTITLILEEGTPYGIKTVRMANWSGNILFCNRTALKKIKNLAQADSPAAYFLFGQENEVYVGETEDLGKRLGTHARGKDFLGNIDSIHVTGIFKN